jgi:hypothetical protein
LEKYYSLLITHPSPLLFPPSQTAGKGGKRSAAKASQVNSLAKTWLQKAFFRTLCRTKFVQVGRTKNVPLKNTAGGQAGRTKNVPLKNTASRQAGGPHKNNAGKQAGGQLIQKNQSASNYRLIDR